MRSGCAGLLFLGLLLNWLIDPTRAILEQLDRTEYQQDVARRGMPDRSPVHGST
jgi:hypothetical protein